MEAPAVPPAAARSRSFRELYCEAPQCEPDTFERHLFSRAVRARWRWALPLLLRLWPESFRRDLRELGVAGHATSPDDLKAVAAELRHDPREPRTFLRDTLGVRVSGRQLLAEGESVWRSR